MNKELDMEEGARNDPKEDQLRVLRLWLVCDPEVWTPDISRISDSKSSYGAEHISDQNCHVALLEKVLETLYFLFVFCLPSRMS